MRQLYRRFITVEWIDTQRVSHKVELTRRNSPRAYVVLKRVLPYVESSVPTFRRSGMRDEWR